MKLATWNVNGLRARQDFVLHWLRSRQPDVVGFQELKLTEEQFPFDVFEAEGYRSAIHAQKSWNGVAVLSKHPLEVRECGLPGEEAFGARLISVDVEGIRFITIYAPNGKTLEHDDYPKKLVWYDRLADWLGEHVADGQPAVLCGDFNICTEPIDSWNEDLLKGRIFHTDEERSRMKALADGGWIDSFRRLNPDAQVFSWWDYRGGAFHRKQGLRIDLLLATAPLMERIEKVETDRDYRKKKDGLTASDHAPVIATLKA
ncbi:hypothetical protein ABI59_15775 [Acidobacteria bacterium Mor1]|nr:hypothetical protein ABI59_15775 [Acidobacteria bacterium Mor1]